MQSPEGKAADSLKKALNQIDFDVLLFASHLAMLEPHIQDRILEVITVLIQEWNDQRKDGQRNSRTEFANAVYDAMMGNK